jgi:hypothetical protein
MIIAILLPEVVLFCAWEQWWGSRKLRVTINELEDAAFDGRGNQDGNITEEVFIGCAEENRTRRDSASSSSYHLDMLFREGEEDESEERGKKRKWGKRKKKEKKKETWTMEQAFFALSGGFAVESSSFSPHKRITFTWPGIILLAKLGLLPNETPETVSDKSKADYVAKALVCLQAGWFFIQCIARVSQKLPLTLLELHVLAHVLCAFAMYVLWIRKPYDVCSPILCRDETVVDLAALFALHVKTVRAFTFLKLTISLRSLVFLSLCFHNPQKPELDQGALINGPMSALLEDNKYDNKRDLD